MTATRQVGSSFRIRRHYFYKTPRSHLSEIARTDRDRTATRMELGIRAWLCTTTQSRKDYS